MKRFTVLIPGSRSFHDLRVESKWRDEQHCRDTLAAWLGRPAADAAIIRENPETLEGVLLRKQAC